MKIRKHSGKKILSAILTVIMVLTMIPFAVVTSSAATVTATKAATIQYAGADRGNGKLELTNDDFASNISIAVVEFADVSAFANADGVTFNADVYNFSRRNNGTFDVYASTVAPVNLDGVSGTNNKLYNLADITGNIGTDWIGTVATANIKSYLANIGAVYCGTFEQTGKTEATGSPNVKASVSQVVKEAAQSGKKVYITMLVSEMITSNGYFPGETVSRDIWSDVYINNSNMTLSSDGCSYSALDSAISAYESKMNGTIYKNMLPAYKAYIAALEARDAYKYGGDTTADAATAELLNVATNNMTEWKLHNNYAHVNPATFYLLNSSFNYFIGDVDSTGWVEEVYSDKNVANNIAFTWYTYDTNKNSSDDWKGNYETFCSTMWYNMPTVLIYDGEETARMPVMLGAKAYKDGTKSKTRYVYSCYPGDAEGNEDSVFKLNDFWHENDGTTPNYVWSWKQSGRQIGYNSSYNPAKGTTNDNCSYESSKLNCSSSGDKGKADDYTKFYANVMSISDAGMNGVLYKTVIGESSNFYYRNTGDSAGDKTVGQIWRSIGVVNFAYHKARINTTKLSNVRNYSSNPSAFYQYLEAIDKLSTINLSFNYQKGNTSSGDYASMSKARLGLGYDYMQNWDITNYNKNTKSTLDANMISVVEAISADLTTLSNKVVERQNALSDGGAYNTNYVNLRNEITTSKAIYEGAAQYSASTWSAFTAKYEAAQSFMAGMDNDGIATYYNDPATAATRKSELETARNDLQHTITFINNGETTTVDVDPGVTPVYSGSLTKAADDTNHYAFDKWSPAIVAATTNVTYTAVYTATAHDYEYVSISDTHHHYICNTCGHIKTGSNVEHSLNYGTTATEHWLKCDICGYAQAQHTAHDFEYVKTAEGHKQRCTICNYETALDSHSLIEQTDASAHWTKCTVCDYETTKIDHELSLASNGSGHWNQCSGCSYTTTVIEHSYNYVSDADGHWQKCSVCYYETAHTAHNPEAKYDTAEHWTECTVCQYETEHINHVLAPTFDGTAHWQKCTDCDYTTEHINHSLKDDHSDSQHWQYCENCDYTTTPVNHSFTKAYDGTKHWDACDCGYTANEATHTFTAESNGKCTGCDFQIEPADYSAVQEAIPDANELDLFYENDENLAALNTLVNSVYWGYTNENQDDVDKYAADINAAVDNLTIKRYKVESAVGTDMNVVAYPATQAQKDSGVCVDFHKNLDMTKHYMIATVHAPRYNNGQQFSYWVDENGKVVSTYLNYSFFSVADRVIRPVYGVEVTPDDYIASDVVGVRDNLDGTYSILVEHSVSSRASINSHGVVYTFNSGSTGNLTIGSADENRFLATASTTQTTRTGLFEVKTDAQGATLYMKSFVVPVGADVDGAIYGDMKSEMIGSVTAGTDSFEVFSIEELFIENVSEEPMADEELPADPTEPEAPTQPEETQPLWKIIVMFIFDLLKKIFSILF